MADNALSDEYIIIHLFLTIPKDTGIITPISLMGKLRLTGWGGHSQLAQDSVGLDAKVDLASILPV